jgi:erythronate-4-phosphate dehydrogenase
MKIVVDENIPLAREAFAQLGELVLLPGRTLSRADLDGADALIVRSVTKVGRELLEDTRVRFVGTATIGTEHLDTKWLEEAGIAWASAQGCNSQSVAEWVAAVTIEWCLRNGKTWRDYTIGIVGEGNIGSAVWMMAEVMIMGVLVNDPPRQRNEAPDRGSDRWSSLEQVLAESDIVTLHVPMIHEGIDKTHHLIGKRELAMMKDGALLINASRGGVVESDALEAELRSGRISAALDVYENEPTPRQSIVEHAFLATPHIAGYSFEGKVQGTRMMGEAVATHFGLPWTWDESLAPRLNVLLVGPPEGLGEVAAMRHAIIQSYDIRRDDAALRAGLGLDEAAWGRHFDALRKNYPVRREFMNYIVHKGCGSMWRAYGWMGFNYFEMYEEYHRSGNLV